MPDDKNKQNPNNPINELSEFKNNVHNTLIDKKKELNKSIEEGFPVYKKLKDEKVNFIKQREQEHAENSKTIEKSKDKIHNEFIADFPFLGELEKKIDEVKQQEKEFANSVKEIKKTVRDFFENMTAIETKNQHKADKFHSKSQNKLNK